MRTRILSGLMSSAAICNPETLRFEIIYRNESVKVIKLNLNKKHDT